MPFDTSPEAAAVQLRVLKAMSSEQRFLIALNMSESLRATARKRIQQEHADWSEREVIRELLRLAFFPDPLPEWVP